jgi:carbon-monoxide dehydrogenase large subunit
MAVETQSTGLIGARIKRVEDPKLLAGRGRYIDDIALPGMLEAAVLRSPHPHARILRIDTSRAQAWPGVFGVITGADLQGLVRPQPVIWRVIPDQRYSEHLALATDRVRYVGQAVAAVAAVDRHTAEDALELIEVEYDPLTAVVDLDAAMAVDAPRLYDDWPSNEIGRIAYQKGDVATALAEGEVVIRRRFRHGRQAGVPLEPRGCIVSWDPLSQSLHAWLSTQSPHLARDLLGEVLQLPVHQIHVHVPEIGGGFGNKFDFYAEEVLAAVLSRHTGRPVKVIEDRLESFLATAQSREQVIDVEWAATREGLITGLKATVYGVLGGVLGTVGIGPTWLATTMLTGPYKIPNVSVECVGVMTNKAPAGSFRGWGQPEAALATECMIELLAKKVGLDRSDVRRRNFVPPDEFPYVTGVLFAYDSGRYADCLQLCLDGIEERRWSQRQAASKDGRSIGMGFGFHVEATALGPSRILNLVGLTHSGFEEGVVRIDSTGRVTVSTGNTAMGQGIQTALTQVAAQSLGVPLDHVTVIVGDESTYTGYGTGASRAAALGSVVVMQACAKLKDQVLRIAGQIMEADPADLAIDAGRISVKGSPDRMITIAAVGDAAYRRLQGKLPEDMCPTLEERVVFDPENLAWSYGCTAVLVEVDRATGFVRVLDYLCAHDCGTVINPMIVEGQIHGGAAQGLGGALLEELVYSSDGQPLTTTFMDYLVPTASELPALGVLHMETPAPHIPGGAKGMGEAGTIGAPAAVVNAVNDALSDLKIALTEVPITPSRLRALIKKAEGK